MKIPNITEFRNQLSRFLQFMVHGEEIEVREHNIPIARALPVNPEIACAGERKGR